MSDIIRLLPDSVANQIAAGEVIQRPASVVKELVENSIDAEADSITVNIKDAGRTLIQVIDNGKGMSETDARMAFERHATSKIRMAEDLFAIQSMGFRGEALASISAVADVDLKTKQVDQDLGTHIHIKGSEVQKQETVSVPVGSNFSVKNLFYNIPARRKFLKKDITEFKHIVTEFKKTALSHPEINMTLIHNDSTVYKMSSGTHKKRIIDIFGKHIDKMLIPVESETSIINIKGYIGKPETAKRRNEEQFFFVNKRFMRHAYFYKALLSAYEQIIKPNLHPSFFLYLDIEPNHIDINIHPAKIQINFENTQGIYQLMRAAVRKALGSFNIVPSIDFDRDGYIEMPYSGEKSEGFVEPAISGNDFFNPFEEEQTSKIPKSFIKKDSVPDNWESLYKGFKDTTDDISVDNKQRTIDQNGLVFSKLFQLKLKYIVTPVKSGLMLIHITRAHERVLFESLQHSIRTGETHTQKVLYPVLIEFNSEDFAYLNMAVDMIRELGFDIDTSKNDTVKILGVPAYLINDNVKDLIEAVLTQIKDDSSVLEKKNKESVSEVIAKKASMSYAKPLASEEMQFLIDRLFSCQMPNFTNDGRKIIEILNFEDLEKKFK